MSLHLMKPQVDIVFDCFFKCFIPLNALIHTFMISYYIEMTGNQLHGYMT